MPDSDKIPHLLNGTPVQRKATLIDRLAIEARWFLGSILNLCGVPGLVRPIKVYDQLTDTQIEVATDRLFTVITINGRDLYFRRLDGKYDGSGIQT